MIKYKCIIIDDEQHAIEGLKTYIEKTPSLTLVKCYNDPVQALMDLQDTARIDLLLMDIDMPNISGIELSKQLRQITDKLVFTTGYTKYGYEAFEVSADAYLLKPYSLAKFVSVITRLFPPDEEGNSAPSDDYFFVKNKEDNHKLVKVSYHDIIAVESKQNYVMIYTGNKNILTYMSLTEVTKILARFPFFVKYHRSFIINSDHIESISGNMVKMNNGLLVAVGDNFRKEFTDYLDRKLLKAGHKI